MNKVSSLLLSTLLFAVMGTAWADEQSEPSDEKTPEMKAEERRQGIDQMAKETLDRLLSESPGAKGLYEKCYGYAVFDNLKLSLLLASARGSGVAVVKKSGDKIYMKMGSLGLNIGLGGQKMQVVLLFEDAATFDKFVNKGWKAEGGADAAGGKKGVGVQSDFVNGMAVYQFTEAGLMLQANISGTKYYRDKKLN